MTTYRDLLLERHGHDIGSVVGCALDRLERPCSAGEIDRAIDFYWVNQVHLAMLPRAARRDQVARSLETR